MSRFNLVTLFQSTLPILLAVCLIGCGRRADDVVVDDRPPVSVDDLEHADHAHVHVDTYAEAVTEIERMNNEISTAFAANDLDAADGPIHEIGDVLEETVALARKENFSEEAVNEIKAAVDTLMDAFTRVDDTIHGREGATYEEVKDEVEPALETLRGHVPPASE